MVGAGDALVKSIRELDSSPELEIPVKSSMAILGASLLTNGECKERSRGTRMDARCDMAKKMDIQTEILYASTLGAYDMIKDGNMADPLLGLGKTNEDSVVIEKLVVQEMRSLPDERRSKKVDGDAREHGGHSIWRVEQGF